MAAMTTEQTDLACYAFILRHTAEAEADFKTLLKHGSLLEAERALRRLEYGKMALEATWWMYREAY